MIFEEKINKVKMQFLQWYNNKNADIINSDDITAGVKSAILQKKLILSSCMCIHIQEESGN